ncbi:MAG TPA: hypothetical protein VFI58_04630 [Xanthobacteraceae bacterium]|jgi:hypothetical protein|nr:hypothetical protein [Xanthobacteraceae bacterium]
MAEDSKFPNLGGNGFIWILLVAAGTYLVAQPQVSLQGSRPASTERSIPERVGEQHVDARLWQDPFAAVADYLAKSSGLNPKNCDGRNGGYEDIETYCRHPLNPPAAAQTSEKAAPDALPDLTLVVSASASSYSEDQEARRRKRYAVLAGLNAEGFVPENAQHIGFFWPGAGACWWHGHRIAANGPCAAGKAAYRWVVNRRGAIGRSAPVHSAASPPTLPKIVPYEWFRRDPERVNGKKGSRILVLWFDEDALAANAPRTPAAPLQQFAKLLCPSPPAKDNRADKLPADKRFVKILGPQLSTTLKAMVDEVNGRGWSKDDWSGGICPNSVAPPQFYVSDATASDATLMPDRIDSNSPCLASGSCLRDFFRDRGIALYRLIATDEALARTITAELALRGVVQQSRPSEIGWIAKWNLISAPLIRTARWIVGQPADGNHHIVLISEWDTLYGRALPDTMARCLRDDACKPDKPDRDPGWLHRYEYLRGLDGQMPNVAGLDSGSGGKDSDNKPNKDGKDNKDSIKNRPDPSAKDRPEGQGQYDYLRRLGDRIRQLDAELRSTDQGGIAAVGVLGSDVYDKLLVLQALRPLFSDAWFFTTDLDALLLHPAGQSTRNLLVASGFGLQLRPDIQKEIPPFRSSYQTAEFLAARVAVRSDEVPSPCWSKAPLLFEIGSSQEFQFAGAVPPKSDACEAALRDCEEDTAGTQPSGSCTPARSEFFRADHPGCKDELTKCHLVQPVATAMVPELSTRTRRGLAGVGLLIGFGLVFFPGVRLFRHRDQDGMQSGSPPFPRSTKGLVYFGILTILGVGFVMATPVGTWLTQGGQPIRLLEGISLWPTIFLRLATLLLCIWLLLFSLDALNDNLKQIEDELHLKQVRDDLEKEQTVLLAAGRRLTWLARRFGYRLPDFAGDDVLTFWGKYFYRGRLGARIVRVVAGVVAMGVLWCILFLIFGNPHAPTRGDLSAVFYYAVTPLLFGVTLLLIFFVADATWLCWQLTRDIRTPTIVWPERTLREFSRRYGLPQGVVADCIDLLFVAKRSKRINTLLYWPFLIIALIVVSHSPVLANYGRSIPDLVTMAVAVLIVTFCGVALRLSAEATRAEARRRLTERLMIAKGESSGAQTTSQLELLLRRIEELREGAFSPFSQQPLVRAMLLPLGSFGGTALLGYVLGPGFG